ncbi:MAG: glycosyltransferase [Planctomycetes bacterium]|nr:glycosyltransferase [Planctomycetota bacterium]
MKKALKNIPFIFKVNSLIKGYLQEKKAHRELTRHRLKALEQGLKQPDDETLKQSLHQRLANRLSGCLPKPKGDLHIFLAYHTSNWERILPLSLEPFGKVITFDWRAHGFDDRQPDWLSQRDQMNAAMLEAFHQENNAEPIDVVIGYLSGYNTSPQTLHKMTQTGAVIFNFCWDDKLSFSGKMLGGRYTGPAGIAHAVDLNLTNSADSLIKYAVNTGLAMFWPEAAHPDVHRPYNAPFEFDVSFAGACYGQRPSFIKKLARHNIKVECFGHGWPNGPLPTEDMIKLYSRSRINLGFAGIGHSRKLMCLKGRDFEVPMSGGLYLTQNNPELSMVFNVGKEILTYRNKDDCANIIKKLLAEPDRAETIRKAGRKRCLNNHSYYARWSQIFQIAGLLEKGESYINIHTSVANSNRME